MIGKIFYLVRADNPPARGTTLTISTVDRYQGDENDIVILSLVRCKPGNRFVGLLNRFIVATSRARLGFFIIGTVEAVTKYAHWERLVKILKAQNADDKKNSCGNSFPICCPRHGDKTKLSVTKSKDFPDERSWNKFCSLPCDARLKRCGHLCKLPCHSPTQSNHNDLCIEVLERPCETHTEVPLLCHSVNMNLLQTIEQALQIFECEVKVDFCRPECGHNVKITCHEKTLIVNKKKNLNNCQEVVSDYIHPTCNHIFPKPKCFKKREYEINPPKCQDIVIHQRPCGCKISMHCYEKNEEILHPTRCNSSIEIDRPRCGHKLSMRCYQADELKQKWDEQSGKSALDGKNNINMLFYVTGPN
jgi:hypothetical protein